MATPDGPDGSDDLPPTRWETGPKGTYAERFASLIAEGADVDGEARLADALVQRGARILDAGSGIGRVGATLAARGHDVICVEKDAELVAESRRRYPGLEVVESDLLALPDLDLGAPFDLVVLVGNVLVLLAPATEQRLLAAVRDVLAPTGRVLVGFHAQDGPTSARAYPYAEFAADVAAADLTVQHRFGTYELAAPSDDYTVAVLSR
ncbi:MAG TPA: class I SAM-dependent methyltransferase [Marmoricola sp.]|jgi:SAM-dependent methyltransferase|nr:class I SAM-dependent methyltransferase [Marmoricola sp.]